MKKGGSSFGEIIFDAHIFRQYFNTLILQDAIMKIPSWFYAVHVHTEL